MSRVNVVSQAPITLTKTEVTLMEVTTVSGAVAVSTAPVDVGGYANGVIYVDHAYLDTGSSGVIGVSYSIEVSQKASGNDAWRAYQTFRTALLSPTRAVTPVAGCLPGETTISLASNGASGVTSGDRVFFQNNANFAGSEWAEVVFAASNTINMLIRDGLASTQQSSYVFNKAEQYVTFMDLRDVERLRVTMNNALYTNTNKLVAFRARGVFSKS